MTALSILHDSRRGADHLKLGAHALDLCGLLSELGCESLYLFLLLRDHSLQLFDFLIHGLSIPGLRAHARLRCATIRRSRMLPCAMINAKVVVIKVHSNKNNVVAVNGL